MKKGILIYNGFLKNQKFDEIHSIYQAEAEKLGITLDTLGTNKIHFGMDTNLFLKGIADQYDFGLYLDKDVLLARTLERLGLKIFNSSKVIEVCDNKAFTFHALSNKNIHMPKTIIAPLIFGNTQIQDTWIDGVSDILGYPIVIKECFGSFGEQVYLANNKEELLAIRFRLGTIPHLYQEFISSSYGRDIRINLVGNKVIASMIRTSETDFRANITQGGTMQNCQPPKEFIDLAINVANILKSDFIGVDILFDKDETPILCEINSNAHIKNIQHCSGVNIARIILKYILEKLN